MKLGEGYDSEVFLIDGGIEKRYYSHLSLPVIKQYHAIHNRLSSVGLKFDCAYGVSSVLSGVSQVCVSILNLGEDISLLNGRVVTRVPYVEGFNIPQEQDIEEMIFMRFFRNFMSNNGLNFKREDSSTFRDIRGDCFEYDLEIDPMNIMLLPTKEKKQEIIVTDLGASIEFFVHCFLEKNPDFTN